MEAGEGGVNNIGGHSQAEQPLVLGSAGAGKGVIVEAVVVEQADHIADRGDKLDFEECVRGEARQDDQEVQPAIRVVRAFARAREVVPQADDVVPEGGQQSIKEEAQVTDVGEGVAEPHHIVQIQAAASPECRDFGGHGALAFDAGPAHDVSQVMIEDQTAEAFPGIEETLGDLRGVGAPTDSGLGIRRCLGFSLAHIGEVLPEGPQSAGVGTVQSALPLKASENVVGGEKQPGIGDLPGFSEGLPGVREVLRRGERFREAAEHGVSGGEGEQHGT